MAIFTIILTLGLLFGYYNYQRSVAIPKNIDRIRSAQFRLNSWQQGAALFQEAPILGIGFNSYRYGLKEYRLATEDFLETHGASTNDSSLLFVAATTGVIGLIAYLFFLATLVKNCRGGILIAAVFGIIIQSFFANTLFYPFQLVWIILMSSKPTKNE